MLGHNDVQSIYIMTHEVETDMSTGEQWYRLLSAAYSANNSIKYQEEVWNNSLHSNTSCHSWQEGPLVTVHSSHRPTLWITSHFKNNLYLNSWFRTILHFGLDPDQVRNFGPYRSHCFWWKTLVMVAISSSLFSGRVVCQADGLEFKDEPVGLLPGSWEVLFGSFFLV